MIAVFGAASLALLLVSLHLPPVRALVRDALANWLRSQAGIEAQIDSLSYNLLTLDARLHGVVLSSVSADTPFALAEDVHVNLPWRVVTGALDLQELELSGLSVTLVRNEDGTLNLPTFDGEGRGEGNGPLSRVAVGHLGIQSTLLSYLDQAAGWSATVEGLAADLTTTGTGRIGGRLTTTRGPSLHGAGLALDGTLEGSITYDGSTVSLANVVYATKPAILQADGRLDALWSSPTMNLAVRGSAALGELGKALDVEPDVLGSVTVSGMVEGSITQPVATLSFTSDRLQWQHLDATAVAFKTVASIDQLTVDSLTLLVAGGAVSGQGRVTFDPVQATVEANWEDVSADALIGPLSSLPISSRVSGHAHARWQPADTVSTLASVEVRAVPGVTAPNEIGVSGELSFNLEGGAWSVSHEAVISDAVAMGGALGGRLAAGPLVDSSVRGSIEIAAEDATRAIPLLRTAGVALPEWVQADEGRLEAHVTMGGTLGAPAAAGHVRIQQLRLAGSDVIQADTDVALGRAAVSLDDVHIVSGVNTLSGRGTLNVETGAIQGLVEIAVSDVASLGSAAHPWHLTGDVQGRLEIAGTTERPIVRGSFSGEDLNVAGQSLGQLGAEVVYEDLEFDAPSITLRQAGGGTLSGSASYARSTEWTVDLQARSLRASTLEYGETTRPMAATIDGDIRAGGTLEHPEGGGSLVLTDLQWNRSTLDRVDLQVVLSDEGAQVTAEAPTAGVVAEALVESRPPYTAHVSATARESNVRTLLETLGIESTSSLAQLDGTIEASMTTEVNLSGYDSIDADATLDRLDLSSGQAVIRLVEPSSLHFDTSSLQLQPLRLQTGNTTLEVAGEVAQSSTRDLVVSLNGDLADLKPWLDVAGLPAEAELTGRLNAALSFSGSLEHVTPSGTIGVSDGHVTWPGYPTVTNVSGEVALDKNLVRIPTFTAQVNDTTATGRLDVPFAFFEDWLPPMLVSQSGGADVALFEGRVDNVTPETLEPFAGETVGSLTGRADAEVALRADSLAFDRVSGTFLLSGLDVSADGLPVRQQRPTRIELAASELNVADWSWTVAGNPIDVSGHIGLAGDRPVDLRVDGRLDLRVLSTFVPGVTTSGVADLSVAIRGTSAEPLAEGTVQLNNGGLDLVDLELGVSNASGQLVLQPNRVDITGLEANLNGGRLRAIGGLELQGFSPAGGAVSIEAEDVALNLPDGMRTEIDSTLAVALAERIRISGQVDILRGAYREPISLAAAVAALARERSSTVEQAASEDSLLETIDLNVAVASDEDLIVDNNYGRMDLGLDVRLVGTAAKPSVVGRAEIREGGVLFLGGRTYIMQRGVIDFSDPQAIVPELDLVAATRIRPPDSYEYDVTLTVSGTPEDLQTELSANPLLGRADIVSLLATGRLADQVGGIEGSVAAEQVLGYLSGETLGFAAQAIGVDSIRFERNVETEIVPSSPEIGGDIDPVQRLTISRRLSRQIEVTLSQNLRNTGLFTWIVGYSPWPPVELRAIVRDDKDREYEFRHDVSFGGPPAPASRRATSQTRVVDVRFTGNPGFPINELLGELRLRPGDRFDFFRWQEDRDRLRRFYLDKGYLESRVSARTIDQVDDQSGAEDPNVVLEYDAEIGPHTVLDIRGYRLAGTALRELERIWSNTVVEIALVADLRAAVRRQLALEGYLRASVDVMAPVVAGNEKRVTIAIEPGPRSAQRVVQLRGNEILSDEKLEVGVDRLGIDAWLMPRDLATEIALLYRNAGLLAARVQTQPIIFEADRAILPVQIEEGDLFTIADIVVNGVNARAEARVRADFGLTPGSPYTPAALERARMAVNRGYAAEGFNRATTRVQISSHSEEGTIDVRLAVDEGPRQLLRTVDVEGGGGISPNVVSSALGLNTGSPVDMQEWYAGRQRLFRTGLFQRVDIEAVPLDDATAPAGVQPVRAALTLARRAPWRLRYGFQVTDDKSPLGDQTRVYGGRLSANLERLGLFGHPGSVGGSVRVGLDNHIVRGFLTLPSLFGRSVTSRLYAERSHDTISGGALKPVSTDKTKFTAEERVQPRHSLQLAVGYQFEWNHAYELDPDPSFPLDDVFQVARLTASLSFDTRSDPFDPARGLYHSSTVEYAAKGLGSDLQFVKYSMHQFVFTEISPGVVSASALRLGVGGGAGSGQTLIPTERFNAGGSQTVRGYGQDSLGPSDYFGPLGGQAFVVFNQEVRFPIFRWVRGAGFLDAGQVFERASDLTLGTLAVGAGAGLRISTPVGLVRIDLATPLPRKRRSPEWYFGFGHIF